MLRVVGEPRRIDRAMRRLRSVLEGVPARGVRLTWRGGELRTTIHWTRDDSFWWAFEQRPARHALILGHAPEPPVRRQSITCEVNLARAGANRKTAGIVAVDEAGALYLGHSGRTGGVRPGQRKSVFRQHFADGVWRTMRWPDGQDSEALVVTPLDSPRLSRLVGQFVESVHRFKAGQAPLRPTGLCVAGSPTDSAAIACDRRLVDLALQEELTMRGLFGGPADLFSRRGGRPSPVFALVTDGRPEALAMAVGSLSLAWARGGPEVRRILIAPQSLAEREQAALGALPFRLVRFRWRGARAIFDGLDDALA